MKLVRAVLSLLWLSACSFPAFEVHPPSCNDGKLNGEEIGVDCGSAACGMASCANGQSCKADADCSSEKCQGGVCKVRCLDGERDGVETGKDCGIAACSKPCPAGQGCAGDADCDGGKCQDNICRAASCEDHLKNSAESDVDCGGEQGCARCSLNQHCNTTADCDGGLCASGQCRAPTCKDELTNGNESDIDCGGDSCQPCAPGKSCAKTEDCDGVACTKDKCQPAACDDQLLNLDETDLDCGGSCATQCEDGKRCKLAADCQSGVCPTGTKRCAVPSCTDGVLNGDEPTVDCGASCATKCSLLDACGANGDCSTASCVSNRCLPTAATGKNLSPLNWTATASDSFKGSTPKTAIDGVAGTDWTTGTNQTLGMWFTLDMQAEQAFFSIEIDCINSKLDYAKALDVAFSSDGTFTGKPAVEDLSSTSLTTVITFQAPQVARFIRFSIAETNAGQWWRMDEIRVKQ